MLKKKEVLSMRGVAKAALVAAMVIVAASVAKAENLRNVIQLSKTTEQQLEEIDSTHVRIALADSCTLDVYKIGKDSVLAIETVCVPLCSSVVWMCDSKGEIIYQKTAPKDYVLPVAYYENGTIRWEENWKDEEKK